MSVKVLAREMGTSLRCDYYGCEARVVTATIRVQGIRTYARELGWIRGLDKGSGTPRTEGGRPPNTRWDVCPEHAVQERAQRAARDEVNEARRARRRDLAAMTPEQKWAEQRKVKNAAARRYYEKKKKNAAGIAALLESVKQ